MTGGAGAVEALLFFEIPQQIKTGDDYATVSLGSVPKTNSDSKTYQDNETKNITVLVLAVDKFNLTENFDFFNQCNSAWRNDWRSINCN